MTMKAVVLSYSPTSKSGQYLTSHLEGRMIASLGEILSDECVINWGAGYAHYRGWQSQWLNPPSAIERCVDKCIAFDFFRAAHVPHPDWTYHREIARDWLHQGHVVLARATASGMMGQGISILNNPQQEIPPAAFYSKHVQHDQEFRVLVFKGMVINIGEKRALHSSANLMVRNADERDWDFFGLSWAPDPVLNAGCDAVNSLKLDFGAADIGYSTRNDRAYVFEVNSAPGHGHNTITKLAAAINNYLRSL